MWISDCANMITVFIAKIFFCKRFLTTSFRNKSEHNKRESRKVRKKQYLFSFQTFRLHDFTDS
jgi:hypothetical protein